MSDKPSKPYGTIHQDAVGNTPVFTDNGIMHRVILNAGLQDVIFQDLKSFIHIRILGGSSDHMIIEDMGKLLKVGDEVEFNLNYPALLRTMSSPFVEKRYCHVDWKQSPGIYHSHTVNL